VTVAHRPYGSGRVYRRGRRWWIAYYAFGQERRESSYSRWKPTARALLADCVADVALERAARQYWKARASHMAAGAER